MQQLPLPLAMFGRFAAALAVLSLVAGASPGLAAPTPTPTAATRAEPKARQSPRFSTRVHLPTSSTTRVSSAACNRRTVGVHPPTNQMGPNGANGSQTLVAVPIGGSNVAQATTDQQITELCAHQRH